MLVARQVGTEGEEELMESLNTDGWGEKKIRTPGTFADPREMNAVIRELFCHDSVTDYQRRVVEAALREAIVYTKAAVNRKLGGGGITEQTIKLVISEFMACFDPDSEDFAGYFPAKMVCTEHESPVKAAHGMEPVFSSCPGVPWCMAHQPARVEQ